MEAATVLHLPDTDTGTEQHGTLMTRLAHEAIEMGADSNPELVAYLLDHMDFAALDSRDRHALTSAWVRTESPFRTSHSSGGGRAGGRWIPLAGDNGRTESQFRLTASSVWDAVWTVGGTKIKTRDLTLDDVRHLKSAYRKRTAELLARAQFFTDLEQKMVAHRVKTAGALSAKNVQLLDVVVDAND